MADPTNPAGAGGPPTGGGNGGQPLDPAVANVFERMATALDVANQKAENSAQMLRAMAEHAGAVAEEAEKASASLKSMFKHTEDEVEQYKEVLSYIKKRTALSKEEWRDTSKARKELDAIAKLYEEALKTAKANTKETKAMTTNLTTVKRLMQDLPNTAHLTEEQLAKVAETMELISRNAKDVAAAMTTLSQRGAALKGMTGVLSSLGIGKGTNARMERRLEQIEEVKEKIAEARQLRATATMKSMTTRRANILAGMGGPGALTTAEDYSVFAKRMGFKGGAAEAFIGGERAMASGGEAGAAWTGAMEGGTGTLGKIAGVFEGGIESLVTIAPEIIIPLELLIEVIKALIDVFDGYVKQNQEMESKLAQGGLFTQPGMGAGEAFARARLALMPPVGMQGLPLGVTFERNLAVAGGLAAAGFGGAPGAPGLGNQANAAPGANGEFMRGTVGEAQRIVFGVSRLSGLTDQEGVENLIKLLETYHETMASAENFMSRINKDTQAAGISTTKYLKILDEVNGSFDKMSKSLEQVTGIMKELTRYGSISSETLKDLMEGLLKAGPGTTMGEAGLAGYAQTLLQGSPLLAANQQTEFKTLQNYINNFNEEAKRAGFKPGQMINFDNIQSAIKRGDFTGAQAQANAVRGTLLGIQDKQQRQQMETALQNVQSQISHAIDVSQGGAMSRVFGMGIHGKTPAETLTQNLAMLQDISRKSGLSMAQIFAGGGGAGAQGIVVGLNEMFKQAGMGNLAEMARTIATGRVEDVRLEHDPQQQKADAKGLFFEFYKGAKSNHAIATYLTEQGLGKFIKKNSTDALGEVMSTSDGMDALLKLADSQSDTLGTSENSLKKLVSSASEGNDTSDATLAHNLQQAREVGLRTQTVEDILKNVFTPLLNALVESVEFIATTLSKLVPGANFQKDQARVQRDMGNIPKAVDKLTSIHDDLIKQREPLEAKVEKGITLSPDEQTRFDDLTGKIQKTEKAITDFTNVQTQGTFLSAGQMENIEKSMSDVWKGQTPTNVGQAPDIGNDPLSWLKMAAKLTFPPFMAASAAYGGFEKLTGGGDVYNTFYDHQTNQNTVSPSSPATSPGDHAQAPTPQRAGAGAHKK